MAEAIKEPPVGTDTGAAETQGKEKGQTEADNGNHGTGAAAQAETVSAEDYRKLQARLENFVKVEESRKAKEKQHQEELLKEQGKWRDLYETATKENEAMKARLAKYDAEDQTALEAEMKSLPEEFDKTLIPTGDPHDQLTWIRKAKPVLTKAQTPERRGDGTPAPRGNSGLSDMRSIYTNPTSPKH